MIGWLLCACYTEAPPPPAKYQPDTAPDVDPDPDPDGGPDVTGRWLGDCVGDEGSPFGYHVDLDLDDDDGEISGTAVAYRYEDGTSGTSSASPFPVEGTRAGPDLVFGEAGTQSWTSLFRLALDGDRLDGDWVRDDGGPLTILACALDR